MSEMGAAQQVKVEFDVPARMRDGATLRANVYRPSGDGPWPTLLVRTPYDKNAALNTWWLDPVQAAAQGFMMVIQDVRGRFASDGEWIPMHFERQDGYDTVEWAAKLPGSNGRVGMYGASYVGGTPWAAAIEQPPSLAAIAPAVTPSDLLGGFFMRGGAIGLAMTVAWTLEMACAHLERLPLSEQERGERLVALLDDCDRLPSDGFWGLPLHDLPVLRRHDRYGVIAREVLGNDPDVLASRQVAGEYEHVTVPSFNIGGWYDVVSQGVLDNYMGMAALGRPARLVMGPWTHMTYADPIGDLCFGMRASRLGVPVHAHGDLNEEKLAWFRRYLLPESASADVERPPVRIFVMGRNQWRDETSWPLSRARSERWFFGAGGRLDREAPAAEATPTEFVYDPADPAPTHGGQALVAPWFPDGPKDQMRIEARPDVCAFTSEVLQQDLEVTGRVRVVLNAESSAPSTDWVARLCNVYPDGRSFNICEGIRRIEQGADRLQQVAIDLWSTSNVFLAGHRLRVHVTSSCFPQWDRNLNTGNQRVSRMQSARQRIHHDTDRASFVELPVID
ncbi:MAG TPA: CocE/NonD family hydrolase [Solirubrobacteraceae bacterium]|nr:CocE/NonD family hydrolase [Solirubrobacteraceae bacterium]